MQDTNIRNSIIISTSGQHDNYVMLFPPFAVMPFMVVAAPGVRVIIMIVFGSLATASVRNNFVTRIAIGWFHMPAIATG